MILRSITKHLKDQNWFAVGLDLFIVVVGVFIGLQVSNWNETRGNKEEYARSLVRLSAEIETNLAMLDIEEPEVALDISLVRSAFDALLSCVESEKNRVNINIGLQKLVGTAGLHLKRSALENLTSNPNLLAQQSAAELDRFTDMLFYFDLGQAGVDGAEFFPFQERFENNPIISVGEPEELTNTYYDIDYSKVRRRLLLNVPIDLACKNNQLIKSFYSWLRWQNNVPVNTKKIRQELVATKLFLESN